MNIVYALSIVNILGVILLLVQSERRGRKIQDLIDSAAAISLRLTRIETQYEVVPDHEDLSEISEKISGLVTDIATINERWLVTNRLMGTIQQHLLDEDKK